jgi:hypothetical protein
MLLLGGTMAAVRPLRAQQKAMPVIGFLGSTSPGPFAPLVATFHQGLSEARYVEGQNFAIEYRWAENHLDWLLAMAADLVGHKVDLIVTSGSLAAALAAKSATSTIPIVFTGISDPVAAGLVASLARPGGNLTGSAPLNVELMPKRLELLTELVPQARVIALLVNANDPRAERIIGGVQEAAREKGVQLPILKASTESEIDAAFATLTQLHADALVLDPKPVLRQPARAAPCAGIPPCRPGDLCVARIRRGRRADQLWNEPHRLLSPGRYLRRKDPQRHQTGRPAGPATDDVRAGRQSQDRQGTRAHGPAIDPRPRRRGDRVRGVAGTRARWCPMTQRRSPA